MSRVRIQSSSVPLVCHTGESRYPVTFPEMEERRWIPGQARDDGKLILCNIREGKG